MAGDSGEQESSNARHGKCNFEWAPMQNTEYYTPPPPQPLKPSQEATSVFFPYPVHGSYYPSNLRSRKADEQRPQRSGSPTLDSSDSCDSAAQTHLASERPTTARLNIVG